ncbi:activator-dependent family glycosyltransferase [Micromonospora sp. STR1_7]|uniref:Activator-dependent family glycosyltransferase n=1 Tax=Micromonospora parastrephiae TaxID=2806101 RepID=A0ABS1XQ83_9ACTN|nr:activator-dependent family glycosyltransferase [Micromonospora parastrephiae]MBM0231397.1 activator-dependent family glycosyltransferase [Micromonospora parastrephiae]
MRILFTTLAVQTHLYLQVPLAWALRAAGHEVRVASQPDLTEVITSAGLTAVPVGDPLDQRRLASNTPTLKPSELGMDTSDLGDLGYEYMHGLFTVMATFPYQLVCPVPMMDDLVDFARAWQPDLVVWDEMTFAGAVAARVTGAAHVRQLFGLDMMGLLRPRHLELIRQRPAELREDPLAEWLEWSVERYGATFDEEMLLGRRTLSPFPASLELAAHPGLTPYRHVPYNGPAVVPEWLHGPPKRRRICLTLGYNHDQNAPSEEIIPLETMLDAVSDLDADVIATISPERARSLGGLPDNVTPVDFVPLDALLPTCAAVIHTGGAGTSLNAVVRGIPQIIAPSMVWSTGHYAEGLQARGAGIHLDRADIASEDLHRRFTEVLDDPSFAANAAALREEAEAAPSPHALVGGLEQLVAEAVR